VRAVAKSVVAVAFVKVAFNPVTFWRLVSPSTVRVEVTVEDDPTNPPYNWRVEVAKLPRAVTSARVEVLAALWTKQFVPFARQTALPFTKMALALSVEPLALSKPSQTVLVTEPIVAELAFKEDTVPVVAVRVVIEAFARVAFVAARLVKMAPEAKRLVEVTFVKVAFVPVRA
jgi:hypothetical protein